MAVTPTTSATFAPAFSTTTALSGTAAESSSDLGLGSDSYVGVADLGGSDEVIAQALDGNFVSGVRIDPAGDLVAQAKGFAKGLPQAGLFLARVGLLAAEGVTGAGAGAGVALAVAGGAAVLAGGGDDIFAAGVNEEGHGSSDASGIPPAGSRQPPAEVRPESPETVRAGAAGPAGVVSPQMLMVKEIRRYKAWLANPNNSYRARIAELGPCVADMFVENTVMAYFEAYFKKSAPDRVPEEWFEREVEIFFAEADHRTLTARDLVLTPEAGPDGVVSPYMLQVIETRRWKAWLAESSNPYRERIDNLGPAVVENYVEDIVARYFDEVFKDRTGPVSYLVPVINWFISAFEDRLADANKRTATPAAQAGKAPIAQVSVLRNEAINLTIEGIELILQGKVKEGRARFRDAAANYRQLRVGMLPEDRISDALFITALLFYAVEIPKDAGVPLALLARRTGMTLAEGSEPIGAGDAGPIGIVPPAILKNTEIARLTAWLKEPGNIFASRLAGAPKDQVEGAVRDIVNNWFDDFTREERAKVTVDPDKVLESWFIARFDAFLATADRRF